MQAILLGLGVAVFAAVLLVGLQTRSAGLALDIAAVAGLALITYGVWLVFPPAAFIVAGVIIFAAAWRLARPSV